MIQISIGFPLNFELSKFNFAVVTTKKPDSALVALVGLYDGD